jgi:hypothetical protein
VKPMKSATAKPIHLVDALDPIQSAFSDEERKRILQQSREHLAFRPAPRPAPSSWDEDAVQKWKREADEKSARDRAELERERVEQRRRQRQYQRQQETATQNWADYIAGQIRSAMAAERERSEAILIGLLAETLQRHDEMEKRVAALEGLKR